MITGVPKPEPATVLVESPPLLMNTTSLVNAPLLAGATKRTGMLVAVNAGTAKPRLATGVEFVPSKKNGSDVSEAVALSVVLPELVTTKLACATAPVKTGVRTS